MTLGKWTIPTIRSPNSAAWTSRRAHDYGLFSQVKTHRHSSEKQNDNTIRNGVKSFEHARLQSSFTKPHFGIRSYEDAAVARLDSQNRAVASRAATNFAEGKVTLGSRLSERGLFDEI